MVSEGQYKDSNLAQIINYINRAKLMAYMYRHIPTSQRLIAVYLIKHVGTNQCVRQKGEKMLGCLYGLS